MGPGVRSVGRSSGAALAHVARSGVDVEQVVHELVSEPTKSVGDGALTPISMLEGRIEADLRAHWSLNDVTALCSAHCAELVGSER